MDFLKEERVAVCASLFQLSKDNAFAVGGSADLQREQVVGSEDYFSRLGTCVSDTTGRCGSTSARRPLMFVIFAIGESF